MKRLVRTSVFLFSVLLLVGCVKEDLTDCNIRVKLLFNYTGDGRTDIFMDKHEAVHLYVYDQASRLVDQQLIGREELEELQGTWLSLRSGNYRVVCWGNVLDNSATEAKGAFADARLTHCTAQSRAQDTYQHIDSLYYGTYQLEVPETHTLIKDTLICDVVDFESAHIKYEVLIKGLDLAFPGKENPATLRLSDVPLSYDFNKTTSAAACCYQPELTILSKRNTYTSFNTMRVANQNDIVFNLIRNDTNQQFYSFSLIDFLQSEEIDVESKQEITVPILIEFTEELGVNVEVSISVKEWNGIILEPGI